MLKRIREDSELGIQIVKKKVKDLIQRSTEEAEALRTRIEIRKKEKEFDEIALRVGKMLFENLQKGERSPEDPDLNRLLSMAKEVKGELERLRADLGERLYPVS